MASPSSPARPVATEAAPPTQPAPVQHENEDPELEVDTDADSTFGSISASETTSVTSSIYSGYISNGRRYQALTDEYYQPTDEKQWESQEQGHLLMLILDSLRANPLFRSPISPNAQHILDVGTGSASWAVDVADKFPNVTVHGVDLYPPPQKWVAPNCLFEVDDVNKPWTWHHRFDLVHIRNLLGALNARDFERLYRRAYDNLVPGGWIEVVEQDIGMYCDDGSLPADSILNDLPTRGLRAAEKAGRPLDTYEKLRSRIEAAGFTAIQQQDYKMPMGTWPTLQAYKDAGRVNKLVYKRGIEGWCMFLFTQFGEPTPWSAEEVQVYLAKAKNELDLGYHIYQKSRRVWAQKPYDTEAKEEQKVELVDVARKAESA